MEVVEPPKKGRERIVYPPLCSSVPPRLHHSAGHVCVTQAHSPSVLHACSLHACRLAEHSNTPLAWRLGPVMHAKCVQLKRLAPTNCSKTTSLLCPFSPAHPHNHQCPNTADSRTCMSVYTCKSRRNCTLNAINSPLHANYTTRWTSMGVLQHCTTMPGRVHSTHPCADQDAFGTNAQTHNQRERQQGCVRAQHSSPPRFQCPHAHRATHSFSRHWQPVIVVETSHTQQHTPLTHTLVCCPEGSNLLQGF